MANATHDPDVLNLQTLRDLPPIGTDGFGLPIIIGAASMSERVRSYQSPEAAQADADAGDISQSLADYVSDAFGQTLKPKTVMVGRREANVAQVVTFQVTGGTDGNYTITINGTAYTHAASGETAAQIATALQALVDAADDVSAAVVTDTVTVTSDTAGLGFTYAASGEDDITVTETVSNVSIATELTALKQANDTWFGFALESRTDLDNEQAMAWADSNARLAALQTASAAVKAGTAGNIALVLQAAQRKSGFIMYRADASSKAAWKLLTNRLAINLDQRTSTWSFVTLIGEEVEDLTDTEKANLIAANCNYYLTFKKIPCVRRGRNPAGEPIDVVTTAYWTTVRLEEAFAKNILEAVNRGDKVPYDDVGFKILEGVGKDVMQLGERAGHYQDQSTRLVFARFSDLTQQEKDDRLVPFTYGGLLSGAVEELEGTGYATTDESFLEALFGDGA